MLQNHNVIYMQSRVVPPTRCKEKQCHHAKDLPSCVLLNVSLHSIGCQKEEKKALQIFVVTPKNLITTILQAASNSWGEGEGRGGGKEGGGDGSGKKTKQGGERH